MRPTFFIFFVSLVAAMGGLLFGFDIAIINGTIPYIKTYLQMHESGLGFAVGILHIGCIAGTIVTGWLSDRYGRKRPLILAALMFALSAVGTGMAQTYATLVIFRFLAGIAVGAASILSPMYIAEICPAHMRGRMVSLNQLTIVIGILLAYYSNYLLSGADNNWRWMFVSAAGPSLLFFVSMFMVPESPRWLAKKNKDVEALTILSKTGTHEYARQELKNIRESLNVEGPGKVRDLLKPGIGFVVFVGIMLAVFQQFTGVNTIFFYGTEVFAKAGMNINASLFQSVVVGIVNLLATIASLWMVDRFGRKILMQGGSLWMALCLIVISTCFFLDWLQGFHVIAFILLFATGFALTSGPVTWVLISEIFPNHIRGIAMSVATSFLWLACFLLSFTFPILLKYIDAGWTYLIYALICIIAFWFIRKYTVETKGKSLEEIEKMMHVRQ